MRIEQADAGADKGWLIGPWNSENEPSIGYANRGIDEPHAHRLITEIYLIAKGRATVRIGQRTISVCAGELLQIEPGEAHTFLSSSDDYFHFVIHVPGLKGEEIKSEKQIVGQAELGLS